MTRGKNAARADNRERVIADRTASLSRQIARLEAKVAEMDHKNLEQQALHLKATARLRQLIVSNTSEELEGVRADFETAKRTIQGERDANATLLKQHEKMVGTMVKHMVSEHNFTGGDAVQWLISASGSTGYVSDEASIIANLSVEQAYRLDVIRGYRRHATHEAAAELVTSVEYPT